MINLKMSKSLQATNSKIRVQEKTPLCLPHPTTGLLSLLQFICQLVHIYLWAK